VAALIRTLLIASEEGEEYARLVRAARLPRLRIVVARGRRELLARLPSAQVLLADPGRVAGALERGRALEWVQSTWAGVERIVEPCRRLRVPLTGVRGVFGPLISEYVMAYVLAVERHLFETRADQGRRAWRERPYRGLAGLELGVMGLGSIGRHVAATAAGFGMRVRGLSYSGGRVPGVERVYPRRRAAAFLRGLDYLVAALPMTRETDSIFDARFFARLGRRAVFINVGRGGQVVEQDLARALRRRRLRGAVLDVFRREPLPRTSPLWGAPGLIVTPHNAAVSFPESVAPIFIENYRRFAAGRSLLHRVDLERGY
jgi:phosphoglycerate dehydrogenase-like enzyme